MVDATSHSTLHLLCNSTLTATIHSILHCNQSMNTSLVMQHHTLLPQVNKHFTSHATQHCVQPVSEHFLLQGVTDH